MLASPYLRSQALNQNKHSRQALVERGCECVSYAEVVFPLFTVRHVDDSTPSLNLSYAPGRLVLCCADAARRDLTDIHAN